MARVIILLLLACSSPALAVVKGAGPTMLAVESKAVLKAGPEDIYAQIGRIGEWWSPAHSYSGKAANLSLDLRAGGCLCERLDNGGGVEHMRVVYADPANGIRLSGGLGPLQIEPVAGVLSWSFRKVDGGTELTQTYSASGHFSMGGEALAPAVDGVLTEQFANLVKKLAN